MLLLELGVDVCVRHKLLGTSGYHTLYDWYQQVGNEHFPDPTGLRRRMEDWTYGFYPACVKYLMAAFDVPEVRRLLKDVKTSSPCLRLWKPRNSVSEILAGLLIQWRGRDFQVRFLH